MSGEDSKADGEELFDRLSELVGELQTGLASFDMERPGELSDVPVGAPYEEYEDHYEAVVGSKVSCVYVAVHRLNDAVAEVQDLMADC